MFYLCVFILVTCALDTISRLMARRFIPMFSSVNFVGGCILGLGETTGSAQGSLPVVLQGPYVVLGIELMWVVYKMSVYLLGALAIV